MAVKSMFSNMPEQYQQVVESDIAQLKELNAPGFNLIRRNVSKRKAGEKGLKIVYANNTAGGHSTPSANRPDWNEPVAPREVASYVYPTRYRLPMIFDHAVLRDAKNNVPGANNAKKRTIESYMESALKRIERAVYLDGKGSVAYSTSAITALGSATMNCDTTPATTCGHTKGAMWLTQDNWYQAINETTGLPRGTFQVTAPGTTSCTINLVNGTISSGDPIVDVNTFNGYFRGLAWLFSRSNRVIQGINTADYPQLNTYGIDLAGAPLTFNIIEDMITGLMIRNNDPNKKNAKVLFLPPGQSSVLRKSAQNFRYYTDGSNVVKGISEDIDFGNNITTVMPSDLDEDRGYAIAYNEIGMLEEMPLDVMMMDGQEWHQLMGANNTGSENYQRGIGWDGNLYRKGEARTSAYFFRASVTGVLTQSSIGY